MSRRRRRVELAILLGVAVASAVLGALYSWFVTRAPLNGALAGALIGATLTALELFYVQRPQGAWLRRLPTPIYLLSMTLVWGVVIHLAMVVVMTLVGHSLPHGERTVALRVQGLLFAFGISFGVAFALRLRGLVGGRVLLNFLLGRYYRPVREERVFLFLDLKGSTALSERLGDLLVQELIAQFFFDIAAPIFENGGETHRYVGDEVVVTWPLAQALRDARCLKCVADVHARVRELAPEYERRFGVAPEFRLGINGGPVVASEVGDDRREIVYFGDTVNTAARIASACREAGRDRLIAADLAARLPVPPGMRLEPVPDVTARGKSGRVAVRAIEFG